MASPPPVILLVPPFTNGLKDLFVGLAFRIRLSFYLGMSRKKNLVGDHLVTAKAVAKYSITCVHESTIRRWMKNGVTSFGLPLNVSVNDGHLVISLFEVARLREELERRTSGRFDRALEALEAEFHPPDRGPGVSRLPQKSKSPGL